MHHILLLVLLLVVMSVLLYREQSQVQGFVNVLQGRYIRVEMGQVGCLNLAEIEVVSEKGGAQHHSSFYDRHGLECVWK